MARVSTAISKKVTKTIKRLSRLQKQASPSRLKRRISLSLFGSQDLENELRARKRILLSRLRYPLSTDLHPKITHQIGTRGFAICRQLIAPEVVHGVYAAFLENLGRFEPMRNPDSSDPDYVARLLFGKAEGPSAFPPAYDLLTGPVDDVIFSYMKCDYFVDLLEVSRNFSIPPHLRSRTRSFYSEDWHLDSFQPADTLKLFVILHPIDAKTGPTNLLDKPTSREIVRQELAGTLKAESKQKLLERCEVIQFTGQPGDVCLAVTNHCFHKASVPTDGRHRDYIIFRLRPWHPGLLADDGSGRVRHLGRRPAPGTVAVPT